MLEVSNVDPQVVDKLGDIAKNTTNDAILLVIVLIFGLMLVAIPLYVLYTKRDRTKQQQSMERESRILQVIERNAQSNTQIAEAIVALKSTLDDNNRNCDTCKAEQMMVLNRVADKQNAANIILAEIKTMMKGEVHE